MSGSTNKFLKPKKRTKNNEIRSAVTRAIKSQNQADFIYLLHRIKQQEGHIIE